jgi:predicted dehydrogenase
MNSIQVLLVGVCGYGANYINEISEVRPEGVTVSGIVEVKENIEDLYPIIREQSIPVYKSVEDFYKEHEADLAIISTPIHLHFEQIRYCIRHGSNVLTEKPVCTSVEGARKLQEEEKRCGRFISVGYQLDYSRDVLALKKDILAGRLGKAVSMKCLHACRRGEIYYHRNGWAGKISVNGCAVNDSPFNNACAHQFQIMTFLLGGSLSSAAELESVKGEVYRGNPGVDNFDISAVQAVTESGVPLSYYTGHPCREKKIGPQAEYVFENGTVYFGHDFGNGPVNEYVLQKNNGEIVNYGAVDKGARLQKFYDALQAVRDHSRPVCTVQCAIPHLQAVEALAKLPVTDIPAGEVDVVSEDRDMYHEVKHFKEIFESCYENQRMPSDVTERWGK